MILRQIGLFVDRPTDEIGHEIEDTSRVVCSLMAQSLSKTVRPRHFRAINVEVGSKPDSANGKVISGFLTHWHPMSKARFARTQGEERAIFLLDHLCAALTDVFGQYGLDASQIGIARKYTEDRRFTAWFLGKESRELGGPRKARVMIEQRLSDSQVWLFVRTGRSNPSTFLLTKDSSDEFVFQKYLCRPAWTGGTVSLDVDGRKFEVRLAS